MLEESEIELYTGEPDSYDQEKVESIETSRDKNNTPKNDKELLLFIEKNINSENFEELLHNIYKEMLEEEKNNQISTIVKSIYAKMIIRKGWEVSEDEMGIRKAKTPEVLHCSTGFYLKRNLSENTFKNAIKEILQNFDKIAKIFNIKYYYLLGRDKHWHFIVNVHMPIEEKIFTPIFNAIDNVNSAKKVKAVMTGLSVERGSFIDRKLVDIAQQA